MAMTFEHYEAKLTQLMTEYLDGNFDWYHIVRAGSANLNAIGSMLRTKLGCPDEEVYELWHEMTSSIDTFIRKYEDNYES